MDFNFRHIFIEGDNLLIINLLQEKSSCPWKIRLLMDDIKKMRSHFEHVDSRHVYREANRAADYVASLGHQVQTHQDIDPYLEIIFSYFISLDKLGYSLERRLS